MNLKIWKLGHLWTLIDIWLIFPFNTVIFSQRMCQICSFQSWMRIYPAHYGSSFESVWQFRVGYSWCWTWNISTLVPKMSAIVYWEYRWYRKRLEKQWWGKIRRDGQTWEKLGRDLLGRDWMGRENIRNWGEFRRGEIGREEKGWRETRWEKIVSIDEKMSWEEKRWDEKRWMIRQEGRDGNRRWEGSS